MNRKHTTPLLLVLAALLALCAVPALAQRPGDRSPVSGVHPSYTVTSIRPTAGTTVSNGTPWPATGGAMAFPIGAMDFLSDGRLVVTSWRDPYEVFILSNAIIGSSPTTATMTKFATGLTETLGLKVVNDSIYVLEKDQVTLLLDNNNDGVADEYRAISYDWTKSVNSKEYAMGLPYDGTWFYAAFGDPTISSGTSVDPTPAGRQNGVLRIRRSDGYTEAYTGGGRVPGGMSLAYGQPWVAEIQGGYRPSSVVYNPKAGRWYGRPVSPASKFQPAKAPNPNTVNKPYNSALQTFSDTGFGATPFTLNIPFKNTSAAGGGPVGFQRSPAQLVELKTGPFAGQLLIAESDNGESGNGEMVRAFVEKMPNGEYQGAVFHFTRNTAFGSTVTGFSRNACFSMIEGPDGNIYCSGNGATAAGWGRATSVGLDRIKLSGAATPFDILAMRNMGPNTFEFEFTKPLADSIGNNVTSRLVINTWWDQMSEVYGCCRRSVSNSPSTANGVATVTGFTATVQSNRAKVTVTFPTALNQYWIYYARWAGNMRSSSNDTLYGTEAFYTLNSFGPGTAPTSVAPDAKPSLASGPFTLTRMAGGGASLRFSISEGAAYRVTVTSLDGKVLGVRKGSGSDEVLLRPADLPAGIGLLRIEAAGRSYARIVSR